MRIKKRIDEKKEMTLRLACGKSRLSSRQQPRVRQAPTGLFQALIATCLLKLEQLRLKSCSDLAAQQQLEPALGCMPGFQARSTCCQLKLCCGHRCTTRQS